MEVATVGEPVAHEHLVDGDAAFRSRWRDLWKRIGARGSSGTPGQQLLDLWGDPARGYHGKSHLAHGLEELDGVRGIAENPDGIEVAWWFHDAIYLPLVCQPLSEEQSADLARKVLRRAGLSEGFVQHIAELILATKHDFHPGGCHIDLRLITDIDLTILGQPESVFDAYEAGVRVEYRHVRDDVFRSGRADLLRRFLTRKPLYTTDHFRAKYEDAARANLARSLARLESGGPLIVVP